MPDWLAHADAYPEAGSVAGDIRVCRGVAGQGLAERDILVHLPAGLSAGRRYPVLYMHDGQNLFDSAIAFAGDWAVDEAAEAAAAAGEGELIVVAIPNAQSRRTYEYSPWVASDPRWGGGGGDAYLDFLRDTVRPLVEASWPVRSDPAGIGIAGSSLGGLISLYAALTRPGEYGFCGAFSPALVITPEQIFAEAERRASGGLRIYLDAGRQEDLGFGAGPGGVTAYVAAVRRMRDLLHERGASVLYVEDDLDHNEAAWRERFPGFLSWFLGGVQELPKTTR